MLKEKLFISLIDEILFNCVKWEGRVFFWSFSLPKKVHMTEMYYKVLKKEFQDDVKLLYTDTGPQGLIC